MTLLLVLSFLYISINEMGDLIYLHDLNYSLYVDSCYESTISVNLPLFSVHSRFSSFWSTKSILHLTCSKLNSLSYPIQTCSSSRTTHFNEIPAVSLFLVGVGGFLSSDPLSCLDEIPINMSSWGARHSHKCSLVSGAWAHN